MRGSDTHFPLINTTTFKQVGVLATRMTCVGGPWVRRALPDGPGQPSASGQEPSREAAMQTQWSFCQIQRQSPSSSSQGQTMLLPPCSLSMSGTCTTVTLMAFVGTGICPHVEAAGHESWEAVTARGCTSQTPGPELPTYLQELCDPCEGLGLSLCRVGPGQPLPYAAMPRARAATHKCLQQGLQVPAVTQSPRMPVSSAGVRHMLCTPHRGAAGHTPPTLRHGGEGWALTFADGGGESVHELRERLAGPRDVQGGPSADPQQVDLPGVLPEPLQVLRQQAELLTLRPAFLLQLPHLALHGRGTVGGQGCTVVVGARACRGVPTGV